VVLAPGATLPTTTTKDEGVEGGAVKKQTKSVRRQTSFHNQVAGHTKFLVDVSLGKLYKPVIERELKFYESDQKQLPELRDFIPHYYGCMELTRKSSETDSGEIQRYIVLEDCTHNYQKPCILDLKMGTKHHSKNTGKALVMKYKTPPALGFCICGMKVYIPGSASFITRDKYYGREVSIEGMTMALHTYFYNGKKLLTQPILSVLEQLKRLMVIFEKQTLFRFRSSSLLLVYEGKLDIFSNSPSPRIFMIDFAHTYTGDLGDNIIDEGYLFGLKALIKELTKLLQMDESVHNNNYSNSNDNAS